MDIFTGSSNILLLPWKAKGTEGYLQMWYIVALLLLFVMPIPCMAVQADQNSKFRPKYFIEHCSGESSF